MDAHLIQGSDSWKSWRRNCVTATDVSKIIGVNQYCTALKLWNQKLGLEPEQQENEAMRLGSQLEPIALQMFITKTGIQMSPAVKFHEIDIWKMASLDGVSECGKYAVEIKCSKNLYDRAKNGIIDEIYRCQVQWQMYILKIYKIYFACYWNEDLVVLEIERDDDFLNEIMPKIHEFRTQMLDFTPPPATDKDYEISEDKDLIFRLEVLHKLKQQVKDISTQISDLEDSIVLICNGRSTKAANFKITKCTRRGSIDYSSIDILKNVKLDDYRKSPTTYYRIT